MAKVGLVREGGIAVIRFNNPPHGYLDAEMNDALVALVDEVAADTNVRVLIFTGSVPGVFIQHYSLFELEGAVRGLRAAQQQPAPGLLLPGGPFDHVTRTLECMQKPVIAAINGNCMGGGLELAMACDMRIAQLGTYDLGMPEINLGIPAGAGGTQRLPRLIGVSKALQHMMTGDMFSPEEAVRIGLVNSAVPDALIAAMELAGRLLTKSPAALGYLKTLIRSAQEVSLDEGLRLERALSFGLITSDHTLAAMAAINAGTKTILD
jgi:enoyl-CoA hydratase